MYTPEDSPFEKFRTEKLKGVAMSPDVRELVALAYESGFIDGMQKQMQSSVDRAVNAMAEQPAQDDPCPGCRKGGVCRTPKCGRLKLPVNHPYRSEQPAQHQDTADKCKLETVPAKGGLLPAQQEPVACVQDLDEVKRKHLVYEKGMDWKDPLYTSPQPQRQPLTDEQIESIWDSTLSEDVGITALRKIARAIEAAHGITGEKK